MLRLSAQLGRPYRIAIAAAADDGTLAAERTDPAGVTTALSFTVDGATHVSPITPSAAGVHTIDITASDDPSIVGEQLQLVVSDLGPSDFVADHTTLDPSCGQLCAIRWPAPDFTAMPCIDEYPAESVRRWLARSTQQMFRDTAARFPGCYCYALLRPNVSATALCATPSGSWGFDLFPTLRYPALELLEVTVDGTAGDLADWTIERQRWLVPAAGVGWPTQSWDADLGDVDTWSVLIRYGRAPDPLVVDARDAYAYASILATCVTTDGDMACRLPDGTTQINENGRSVSIDPAATVKALRGEAVKQFGALPWDLTQIIDPAEPTARGSRFARLTPGDQTPATHRLWLASGADIDTELAP